jgi:hypothetical protein
VRKSKRIYDFSGIAKLEADPFGVLYGRQSRMVSNYESKVLNCILIRRKQKAYAISKTFMDLGS